MVELHDHRAAAPGEKGPDTTLREILDAASKAVDGAFADEPGVEIGLRQTLGLTYSELGMDEPALLE